MMAAPMPGEGEARILIIDDNPQNVVLIQARLQRAGFGVTSANDGPSGLEAAVSESPDLILLDIMMPGMDGYEVCRRLKAAPLTRSIPVVILTSLMERADKARALEVEADDFLSKSVDQTELVSRVRSLLRLKRRAVEEAADRRSGGDEQSDELAVERSRARLVLDLITCGVLTTDLRGQVTTLNPAAQTMSGVTVEAARGRPWREALSVRDQGDQGLQREGCPIEEVLRTDRSAAPRELSILRPDGHFVRFQLVAAPVRQSDGETVEVVAVLRERAPGGAAERVG